MSVREELIEIHKRLVKKLKTDLYQEYCRRNPQIDQYYDDYKHLTSHYERIATKQELVEQILSSDLVYLGDYHTLRQSQKTLIRLLEACAIVPKNTSQFVPEGTPTQSHGIKEGRRMFTPEQRPIILALEMIQSKHQDILNRYLDNKIDETAFLKAVDYDKTWGFDWNHYKVILDYAKEHHIKVVALNSEPSLSAKGEKASSLNRRDSLAAKIIAQTLRCSRAERPVSEGIGAHLKNPDSTIIVLFGDLHISENHLPLQVDKALSLLSFPPLLSFPQKQESSTPQKVGIPAVPTGRQDSAGMTTPQGKPSLPKKLIICQNSERIYWQLAQAGEEQKIDVVKIKDGVYCVMNSTPLTLFQSCIHWYNQENQMQTHPVHQDWSDSDISTSFIDEVVQLIKTICEFLEMEAPKTDSLTVCAAQDMALLKHIKKETLSPEEAKHLETDLLKTESYFIEDADTICLTNLSLNHAAEQASHFIHHKYTEDKTHNAKRTTQNAFYYATLRETLGFLGSKVINHKRLCYKELDFEDFLNQYRHKRITNPRLKEVYQISLFVVEHKKREKNFLETNKWAAYKKVSYLSVEDFIGISHALGYMLGDRIYEGVLQGIIKRTEIHALFSNPFKGKEALNKYLHLIQRVQTVKETYLRKAEHL